MHRMHRAFTFFQTSSRFFAGPGPVGLTTSGLLRLQGRVTRLEGGHVHPYTIIFLLPIALLTILGGRRVGFLTLTLCFLSPLLCWRCPELL